MSSDDRMPLEAALVRIWRDDVPVGAGFLAGPAHLLSAAHVVADALGGADEERPPVGVPVLVDFPLLAPQARLVAEVVAWQPPVPGAGSDVAGLRLCDPVPDGARPLVLRRRRGGTDPGTADRSLVMVGFPRGLEHGIWVRGRQGGPVATGWVEIEGDPAHEAMLRPGFSGAPVWSTEAAGAVGMVGYRVTGAGEVIGYMIPVDALLAAWPELATAIEERDPYRGLRAFGEQDADLFFGRDELAGQLARRITDGVPLLGVIGPSGVGKSSLWHAGVLPKLRRAGGLDGDVSGRDGADGNAPGGDGADGLAVVTVRPSDGSSPLSALAFALDRLLAPDREVLARVDATSSLAGQLARGAMPDVVTAVLDRCAAGKLVVCVDQFEEVFSAVEGERDAFARALRCCLATGSKLSVVVHLRDTFLGALLRDRSVAELARRWLPVTVGELTDAELRRVMTGPLERIGTVSLADGLAERILRDLRRTPNPLPLLEFTLAELWARRSGGLLTHEAYTRLGGVSRALAEYASQVWSGLDRPTRAAGERLLVQLIRPIPADELTVRRTALRSEIDDEQWAVAQRLAGTRLLVLHEVSTANGEPGGGAMPGVELAHDSLLTHWARLRELTEEFRDFRIWQEALRQRIAAWTAAKRPGDRLLSGTDLRDARRWAADHGEQLTGAERGFIEASTRRRRKLRARIVAVVTAVVTIVSVTGSLIYEHRSRQVAESIAKDLYAKTVTYADTYGSLQLWLRAYRTAPSQQPPAAAFRPPGGLSTVSRLLPDEALGAVSDNTSAVKAASAADAGALVAADAQPGIETLAQAASADGRTLVTTDTDNQVVLWHSGAGRVRDEPLTSLFGPLDIAANPVISRSGQYVAFTETVLANFNSKDVHAPVDNQGLPEPQPAMKPTCVPRSITDTVQCLVVYDTVSHRVRFAKPLDAPTVGGGVTLGIDPTGRVLGVTVADSGDPLSPEAARNTLYLFGLPTGKLLRTVRLPWHSLVSQLWLGPGARTAVVSEVLLPTATRKGTLSLSFVTIGQDTVARRELADPTAIWRIALSLDGRTVAALLDAPRSARSQTADSTGSAGTESPVSGGGQLVAWDTATGAVTARVTGLTGEQVTGTLALDASGRTAWLSSPPDFGALRARDVRQLVAAATQHGTVMSLPSGRRVASFAYPVGWRSVVPLASGTGGPLLLTDGDTLGVVSVSAPLRVITAAASVPGGSEPGAGELCSLLGEQANGRKATKSLVPNGAYDGPLCP